MIDFQVSFEIENSLKGEKKMTSVDLRTETSRYKSYGRVYPNEKGLNIDFAGRGIELEVECEGDIFIRYTCEVSVYFQIFVDKEAVLRPPTEVGEGLSLKIAEGLCRGEHNIRIIRDSDAGKIGEAMAISEVSFVGDKSTLRAPADKDYLIEFVGDSITAGKFTEMQYVEGEAIHKATNSYAYLTAEELDCDFSIVARGGCGFFRISTCPKTMTQLYPYYNGFVKEPLGFKPKRRANLVVLALGTNDSSENVKESIERGLTSFTGMEEALSDLIGKARKMHGENVRIVLLHGMMSSAWRTEIEKVAKEQGVYFLNVTKNSEGGRDHPSAEGHRVIASELCEYIKKTILV